MDDKVFRANIYGRMNEFVTATAHSLYKLEYECFERNYGWNGMDFNQLQYDEIQKGLESGLSMDSVGVYAKPFIPACLMNYMRTSIVVGDKDYTHIFAEIFRSQPVACEIGTTTIHPDDMDRIICLCSMAHMGMELSEFVLRRFTADELKSRMSAEMKAADTIGIAEVNRTNTNNDIRHTPDKTAGPLNSGLDKIFGNADDVSEDFEYDDMAFASGMSL